MEEKSVYMYYGDYEFDPVPLISIDRTTRRIGGRIVGYNFQMTLNGNIVAYTPKDPSQNPNDFQNNVLEIDDLREAFSRDCLPLIIKCGDTEIISCNPKIENLSFKESNNNWINTIPYTITLNYTDTDQLSESDSVISNEDFGEYVDPTLLKYIEDYSISWNVEFEKESRYFQIDLNDVSNRNYSGASGDFYGIDSNNPFEATVTRSISVQGIAGCVGGSGLISGSTAASGKFYSAIDNAHRFIQPLLSGDTYKPAKWGHGVSGISNLTSSDSEYSVFDHYRSYVTNEVAGSIEVTESWIAIGTSGVSGNLLPCKEDFTINVSKSLTEPKTSVSIEGQIKGYEVRTYSGVQLSSNIKQGNSAYENATAGYGSVSARFFPRAQYIFEKENQNATVPIAPLNPVPVNKTVGHQLNKGIITYNIEYDNRPCSFINGSLSENISINDTNPTDVFASLAVLGRPQGPILQSIGTVTSPSREVTFEVTMPTPTGCTLSALNEFNPSAQVGDVLCQIRADLNTAFNNVYTSNDNSSWNPLTGRYSRTVAWTMSDCSGDFTANGPCNTDIIPPVSGTGI